MALTASLRGVNELAPADMDGMYALMTSHYQHVHRDVFEHDLAGKDAVILLHEVETSQLRGFSTQVCFDHEDLRILFSGDTIIHPDHWGGMQLPVMFGRMMQALKREEPHRRLFWMLISKGFRTYRFLPVFFHQFYPHVDRPTPAWEQSLMDSLGQLRFANGYDPAEVFYLGESVLLSEYCGRGIGVRFFEQREAHARALASDLASPFGPLRWFAFEEHRQEHSRAMRLPVQQKRRASRQVRWYEI